MMRSHISLVQAPFIMMVSGMTSLRMPSSISGIEEEALGVGVAVDVHVERLREFAFVPVGVAEPQG